MWTQIESTRLLDFLSVLHPDPLQMKVSCVVLKYKAKEGEKFSRKRREKEKKSFPSDAGKTSNS